MELLAPCLHVPPPNILDPETRYQNRHVDLMIRPAASQILRLRSHIIQHLRNFFLARDFVEVQTPVISENVGGAIAKPFLTEATAAYKGKQLALRIAPELWLKRLVIGGIEKVFEIGTQFRNEQVDNMHNPEFTTCEFYQAYAGLEDIIDITEDLLGGMTQSVAKLKEEKLHKLPEIKLDFTGPFKRLEFIPALEEAMDRPLPKLDGPEEDVTEQLVKLMDDLSLPLPPYVTIPRLLDKLASHYLEPQCTSPTFITHHPESLSPLAKTSICTYNSISQRVTERVELFVNGREIINAYEEENSPTEQRRKFLLQARWKDDENSAGNVKVVDEVYCEALEWGLPPTGGWGVGVDRLVMLFAGAERIGDVLSFGSLRGAVNQGGGHRQGEEEEKERALEEEAGEGLRTL
jgi:lysyl-tRNA synthetase, class II